jgi:AraC-like DNA-binding protein
VLWISAEFAQQLGAIFPAQQLKVSGLLRTAGTKWEFLEELFRNGVRETERGEAGWEMAVIGNTVMLLTQLSRAYLDACTLPLHAEKPALLDRAMAYIEENLSGKITLEETARRLYVSQSTITQAFRKKMGVSFYRCVTQRRLIAAKTLIGEGMQLETVGQHVGFSDYSTFYRAFKQEFGISPRQYRKLQETIEPEH